MTRNPTLAEVTLAFRTDPELSDVTQEEILAVAGAQGLDLMRAGRIFRGYLYMVRCALRQNRTP